MTTALLEIMVQPELACTVIFYPFML